MGKEFSGKTVLVTGASRGIGAATAIAFAQHGAARVILQYHSFREGAENTAAAVRQAGAECDTFHMNLSTPEGIHECVSKIQAGPAVDILVNNAGSLVRRAKLLELTEHTFDEVMNLNVKSVWLISQAVVPRMTERRSGIIINLSSIAARNGGGPGATIYAAAKASVSTITKGLAKELAPLGIRVNAVSPGTVDNHFHEQFSSREILQNVVNQTPAGRLGTNEEVADVILFLSGEGGRYIHGQTIEINGGMYMV